MRGLDKCPLINAQNFINEFSSFVSLSLSLAARLAFFRIHRVCAVRLFLLRFAALNRNNCFALLIRNCFCAKLGARCVR